MKTSFTLLLTTLTLVAARRSPSMCQYPNKMGKFTVMDLIVLSYVLLALEVWCTIVKPLLC